DVGAAAEAERGEPEAPGEAGPGGPPVQPPGDHQVQDEEEVAVELEHDPLPQPAEPGDEPAGRRRERRVDRAQEERVREPDDADPLAPDARAEMVPVDDDGGELRHAPHTVPAAPPGLNPALSRRDPFERLGPR